MLYLLLNLGSLIIPLIFSFHPKIQFYKRLYVFIPALLISSAIYISWDILFTKEGIWGFNHQYIIGWYLFNLPLEEWMFFVCIPYASVFTHYTLTSLYPNVQLSGAATSYLNFFLVVLLLIVIGMHMDKAYTFVNGLVTLAILLITLFIKPQVLRSFYLTFLVILVPFFIVNGILTGSFIKEQVVWYDNTENLGFRLFTIPVEDFFYAFGLILLNILLIEVLTIKGKYKNLLNRLKLNQEMNG